MSLREVCEMCGHGLGEHDRNVRFVQPDAVARAKDVPPADIWMTGADPASSVMMQVNGIGAFVRALLPVRLTGGHAVTFGVWVGIDPNELSHVFRIWWSPQYRALSLDGRLANRVEPWGLLGSPVRLGVLDEESTPFCVASGDDTFRRALTDEWDHQIVLSALGRSA